jgi:hypothetical protein
VLECGCGANRRGADLDDEVKVAKHLNAECERCDAIESVSRLVSVREFG